MKRFVWILLALLATAGGAGSRAHAAECVTVVVIDPDGLPVAGATVTAGGRQLATDSRGRAAVCGEQRTVTVSATGFRPVTREAHPSAESLEIRLQIKPRVETPVIVTGTVEPRELAEINRTVKVLPVEEPEIPAWSLADVLKQDSAIDLRERGPDGTQADLSIRGSSFDQVLVLVNGIRMNDAQTGHHSMDLPLPLESVKQVEVLHGSGSTLYGSDAVGGTINFVTKKPEARELRLMGGLGDFGWNRSSLSSGFKLGRWSQQVAVARDFSTGFAEGRDFRNVAVNSESFLDHSFGTTTLMFGYNDRPFGANGFYCPCNSWEETGTKFVAASQTFGRNPDRLQHRLNFSFRRHNDHFVLFRFQPEVSQNFHQLDTWQGNYAVTGRLAQRVEWSGGLSFLSEGIDSNVAGQRRRERASAFVLLTLRPTSKLTLTAGVREEVWKKWRAQSSPTFSAGYWIGGGFKLRGQIASAFRMPTYTDLYHRDPFNVGNPALVPESAWNYEAGLDWYSPGATQISATWFRRNENNAIDWVRDAGSPVFQSRNFQQLDFHGGELAWRHRIGRARQVGVNYTVMRASRLLPVNAVSRYVFNFPYNQLVAVYNGPLRGDLHIKTRLGAYNREWQPAKALWDLSFLWTGGRWQPFIQATNLLNTYHEAFRGLAQPGRWIRGGVQLRVW